MERAIRRLPARRSGGSPSSAAPGRSTGTARSRSRCAARTPEATGRALARLTDRGAVPEPLRLAHLVGAAVRRGRERPAGLTAPPAASRGPRAARLLHSGAPMCRLFGQHAHPGVRPLRAALLRRERAALPVAPAPARMGHRLVRGRARRASGAGLLPAHADEAFVAAGAGGPLGGRRRARARRERSGPCRAREHPPVRARPLALRPQRDRRALQDDRGGCARRSSAEIDPDLRAALRGDTDSERCFLPVPHAAPRAGLARRPRRSRTCGARSPRRPTPSSPSPIRGAREAVRRSPSSCPTAGSSPRRRRGRTLHLARDAGPRHAFVVASERIGPRPWEEVPEDGFVGTEDGRRAVAGVPVA